MQADSIQPAENDRVQPIVAYRAIRAIFKDKEDTGQVFKLVNALKGKSMAISMDRFRNDPVGKQIIVENRKLLDTLRNTAYLRSLPEGSFGRAYQQFLETEGLSAEGLVQASEEAPEWGSRERENALYSARLRDAHDLTHVLTGYGRDPLGELSVLAFTQAQTRNRGIGVLVFFGMFKFKKDLPRSIPIFRSAWEARRNGKRAAWLPAADWEALLKLPLEEVRRKLNVTTPAIYKAAEPRMIQIEAEFQRKRAEMTPQAA